MSEQEEQHDGTSEETKQTDYRVSELMSIPEAMEQLEVSRSAIDQAVAAGHLTSVRIGTNKLLVRAEVDNYRPRNYRDRKG